MHWKWLALAIAVATVVSVIGYVILTSGKDAIVGDSEQSKDEGFVSGLGTVTYLTFEGGFYGIVADDGKHYDPANLSPEYRIEGLRIYFQGEKLDVLTYHMWGTPIKLANIQRIG